MNFYNNYYAGGMLMPGRNFNAGNYRFGFNDKEMDNEISGNGNSCDYGFRIYNPRLGRFLSVDPLGKSYPWYTPYQFAGNKPIWAIDLDGLEEQVSNTGKVIHGPRDIKKINAQNIQNNLTEVAKYVVSTTPLLPKEEPLIEFSATTEAGAAFKGKVKVFGFGGQLEYGVTRPVTTATFTEEDATTSVGGKTSAQFSIGGGPASVGTGFRTRRNVARHDHRQRPKSMARPA